MPDSTDEHSGLHVLGRAGSIRGGESESVQERGAEATVTGDALRAAGGQDVAVSVVIVSWNTRELLEQCLASIQAHPPQVAYEVWVVDNASADGSAAMVRQRFPWVRLIENAENAGFAAANNQAIRRSQGRYVVLLNSDAEVQPGALQALLVFMEDHPRAGAAGARLLNADGSLQVSCAPMPTPGREFWRLTFLDRIWRLSSYPMQRWETATTHRVEAIKGACLMLRQDALDEVGLLDEGYFMYTEEVDLCYRLREAGWGLWWVPQAQVVHFEGQSTRQAAEAMYTELHRSKVRFYRKFGGSWGARRFKCLLWLAYLPRLGLAALGSLFSATRRAQAHVYRRLLTELKAM